MPNKRVFQYRETDLAVSDFRLEALLGESYEITEIMCEGDGTAQSAIVNIGGENILNIPCIDDVCNISPFANSDINNVAMFEQIKRKFSDVPRLIVGEGEVMTIKRNTVASPLVVRVVWQEKIADELLSMESPGGSKSEDRLFLSWGENQFTIAATATEEHEIITTLQPAGFERFPMSKIVPVNKQMFYMGTVINTVSANPTTGKVIGLQIWKNDESILGFEEEFAPISLFRSPQEDSGIRLWLMPEKILFGANEDMRTVVQIDNSAGAP